MKKKEIESLLNNLDNAYELSYGKSLIQHKSFNNLDFTLFETPLMVSLLYIYFSYTNDLDNDNITDFYSEVFKALYKGHDLTKGNFKREKKSKLNLLDFKKLLSAFSFISIYTGNFFFLILKNLF